MGEAKPDIERLIAWVSDAIVDWDGKPMADAEEARVPISCGTLRALIAHIRALSGAVEAYDSRLRIEMWNALRRNGCTQDDALAAIEKEMSAIRTPIVPAMTEDKAE